ncbi:MAG: RNA polymerase sigma factor [Archangiaceae bacterium]|nr:RNA polymerase sigma factor [Archangiaceae bacterium]
MVTARLHLVPPTPTDDGAVVRALRARAAGAAEALYARARPAVSRTILRLLRSDQDHDELLQLSMIELIYGIERFRGQCSLDAWISVVTAHTVFKHLRSRRRDRLLFAELGDDGSPALSVPAPSATKRAVGRDLLHRLAALLTKVDPAKAEVFVLHDVHGYDLKEIGDILGVTVANAQSRLVRGRKALHQLIQSEPELCSALDGVGDEP